MPGTVHRPREHATEREQVAARLATEFGEAAKAARRGGQLDLAHDLEARAEVLGLAASRAMGGMTA
jgi:hypothetical protein